MRTKLLLLALASAFLLAAAPASAEPLSGTVSGPLGIPLSGICVEAEGPSGGGSGGTDELGDYVIDVPPGSGYIVHFTDCNDPSLYRSEYYNDAAAIEDADPVTVNAGVGTAGINAALVLAPPDQTAPETTITEGPDGITRDRDASFTFEGESPSDTFECSLNGAAFQPCSSPQTYPGLADGSYNFRVRATDLLGNTDQTPAERNFTVDATPPETTINSGPSGTVSTSEVTFTFSSSKPSPTYFCKFDDDEPAPCTSPHDSAVLEDGNHTFSVFAQDSAGNTDPTPAIRNFSVNTGSGGDVTAPQTTIDSAPQGTIATDSAQITFHSSEFNSTYQCRVDSGLFEPCGSLDCTEASPCTYDLSGLGDGPHVFRVFAVDESGNDDETPAQHSFNVDTTVPDTTITQGPDGTTIPGPSATFAFEADEPGANFDCKLDDGDFVTCGSPHTYNSLSAGPHVVQVRARDNAGNVDASPDSRSFTVEEPDTQAPETIITGGPSGVISSSSTSFTFESNEPGASFECRIDGDGFAPCSSPRSYPVLGEGSHTFVVRAIDTFSNADPTPASRSFTVQTGVVQPPDDPDPQANPACLRAQADLDSAKAALTKAKAKLKKAKSKGAKKKAKAKVKKAKAKVKTASAAVASACG